MPAVGSNYLLELIDNAFSVALDTWFRMDGSLLRALFPGVSSVSEGTEWSSKGDMSMLKASRFITGIRKASLSAI